MPSPDEEPATRADIRRLHEKLDDIRKDLHESYVTNADLALLRFDVSELKEWQTWAIRIVLGAVILALLGLVLTARVPQR